MKSISMKTDYELALFLQETLVGFSTQDGCGGTAQDYIELRNYFVKNQVTRNLLPEWLRRSRDSI